MLVLSAVGVVVLAQRSASPPLAARVVRVTGLPGPSRSASYLEARFMLDPAEGLLVHPAISPLDQAKFSHGR